MESLGVVALVVGGIVAALGWLKIRDLRAALEALTRSEGDLQHRLKSLENWVASLEQIVASAHMPGAQPSPPAEPTPGTAQVVAPRTEAAREVVVPRAAAAQPPAPPPASIPEPARLPQPPTPSPASESPAPILPTTPPPDWPLAPSPAASEAQPPMPPTTALPPAAELQPAPEVPAPMAASPAEEQPAAHEPAPRRPAEPLSTTPAERTPPPEPPPVFAPPPRRAPPPPPPPSALDRLAARLRTVDWEQFLGVKLFSVVGGVFLLLGALFFARMVDWGDLIPPPVRIAMLIAFGLALIVPGELRWGRGYPRTVEALAAAGIAVLFAAFFSAHAIWQLISALPTFGLLALVAAVAVLLSIRRSSLVIAILGLLGGFLTPILLSTGQNQPFGLFSYLLLLNTALAWVAYKKRWPILSALSILFTLVYQAGWAIKFLDQSQLPIAIGVFLVFPLVGFVGIAMGARRGDGAEGEGVPRLARLSAIAGALPPSILALYVSSSAEFAAQWPLVLGFAVIVAAGLAAIAAWQGPEWLHLAGGATVLAALAGFLGRNFDGSQWPLLAAFLAALVVVYLGAPLLLARLGRDFRAEGKLGVLTAPLVLSSFVVVAHAETATPLAFLLPLLVLTAACAGYAVVRGEGRVHLVACAIAVAAEASWSAFRLSPDTLFPALLAYGAFAAVFLGAPLLAERRGKPLTGAWPGPLVLASVLLLLFPSGMTATASPLATIIGVTLLAALLQTAMFARASRQSSLVVAVLGVVAGYLVLTVWSAQSLPTAVLPGLLAIGVLSGVALVGGLLAPMPAGEKPLPLQAAAPHLAIAGYLFVSVVSGAPTLAFAATAVPWLALLGVLDLGFLAAALLRRKPSLLVTAAAGSVWVLFVHEIGLALEPPSPAIAAGGALGVAAFFLLAYLAARRTGLAPARKLGTAGVGALVALHGGQVVLWTGALGEQWLSTRALAPAHALLGLGLLALAWIAEEELVALTAALAGAVAAPILLGHGGTAPEVLWLATPSWLMALAYPLLRGARGRAERLPLVGTVLASGVFLLVARKALIDLGAGDYLGALPVLQAALLVPHLVMLLRMEPPSQRDLGRLALVAAAVLGLLTVAIPLQLDKQWWTIGWAMLGAALAWLWTRIPHRGLLGWAAALLAASFVRMMPWNVWIFEYHARGQTPVFNWYLYAYGLVAAAHFLAAWLFSRTEDRLWPRWPRMAALASAGGALLLFCLVNIEIADFWSAAGSSLQFHPFSFPFGAFTSYTVAWAVFAGALLVAFRRWPTRWLLTPALVLLVFCLYRLLPIRGTPQLDYHGLRILNWYLLAYGVAAAVLLGGAWLLRGRDVRLLPNTVRVPPVLAAAGVLVLFGLVNVEIADFFASGPAVNVDVSEGYLPHLSYTVTWALFALVLAWAFRKGPSRLVLWVTAILLFGAFLRLRPFGSAPLFAYDRIGHRPLLNAFPLAYGLVAVSCFLVAWLLKASDDRLLAGLPRAARVSTLSRILGTLILFFLVNVCIADFWSEGERITFHFSAGLAPDLTYTIAWAVFAIGLMVAGIVFSSRGTRVAAIGLLTISIAKAFVHDLGRLSGMYRVASFLGLGMSAVIVALLLQRFVLRGRPKAEPAPAPTPDPAPPEAP